MTPNQFSEDDIRHRIYTIRGVQVMLDRDLAYYYQVETRVLNQAVKRNPLRFPVDFCFQLTKEETEFLRSQIVMTKSFCESASYGDAERSRPQNATMKDTRGGSRYLPYVFTEEGVGQLSAVLKSEIAAVASVRIQRAFVAMRKFISQNAGVNTLKNMLNYTPSILVMTAG